MEQVIEECKRLTIANFNECIVHAPIIELIGFSAFIIVMIVCLIGILKN